VLVRVHASGVNPLDTKIAAGKPITPAPCCLRCWASTWPVVAAPAKAWKATLPATVCSA
jgi:NADPH:quinone reductase-like Zn-dependent oxidoreductase